MMALASDLAPTSPSAAAAQPRFARLDVWFALGFFVIGAALGGFSVHKLAMAEFFSAFMPDVAHYACGQGWAHAPQTPQPILDFFARRTTSLDCASLPPLVDALAPGLYFNSHYYLAKAVGVIWRMTSVSHANLWPIAAALMGFYSAGLYLLFRLFFGRMMSLAGALVLTFSPFALGYVVFLRDFGKAPFFVWSLLLVLAAARSRPIGMSLALGGAAGVVIGLGYGWRSDLAIMWPLGLIPLLLIRPVREWRSRGAAILAFVIGTFIATAPLPVAKSNGGYGSPLMQGLTDPFQNYLGLGAVPYSFGSRYSDEWTMSTIAADLSGGDPDWEDRNAEPGRGISDSVAKSGPYVLRWLPMFAGDMATQTIKSALWVLGMPALIAPERRNHDWKIGGLGPLPLGTRVLTPYDWIGRSWLPWVSLAGLMLLLMQSHARRPGDTVALLVLFAALLGYVSLQFAPRHFFHLEFMWVMAILAILRAPLQWTNMRRAAPVVAALLVAVALVVTGVRAALAAHQDRTLASRFQELLDFPRTRISAERADDSDSARYRVPVPEKFRALVAGPPDSMTDIVGQRGLQWYVAAGGARLLVTVGGAACPATSFRMFLRYAKKEGFWQNLDYSVNLEGGLSPVQIVVPAIYRGNQHFDALELPKESAPCLQSLQWIDGSSKLPIGLTLVLPANWRGLPLHRNLGGFPISQIPAPPLFPVYDTLEKVK